MLVGSRNTDSFYNVQRGVWICIHWRIGYWRHGGRQGSIVSGGGGIVQRGEIALARLVWVVGRVGFSLRRYDMPRGMTMWQGWCEDGVSENTTLHEFRSCHPCTDKKDTASAAAMAK